MQDVGSGDTRPPSRSLAALRTVASGVAILFLTLLLWEAGLWVGSLFVENRVGADESGAKHRILCVGDSHTWGAGLPREESYPSHLQRTLDDLAPAEYSVINVGLPGMNTSQVRNRLPMWLNRYHPDVVIVWAGINNIWNIADTDMVASSPWLNGLAVRSRLYRALRVYLHDRKLKRHEDGEVPTSGHEIIEGAPVGHEQQTFKVAYDGITEEIAHERADYEVETSAAKAIAETDYVAISELASVAGVKIVFIAYPLETISAYGAVNAAIRSASSRSGAPVVESRESLARIPPEEVEWLWAAHPNGRLYAEVARDLVPVLGLPGAVAEARDE